MSKVRLAHLRLVALAQTLGLLLASFQGASPADAGELRPLAKRLTLASGSSLNSNGREENGFLELSIPTNMTASFREPRIVNNYSVTNGMLDAIQVNDTRWLSNDGWDLQVDVATFVSGANSIAKSSLGLVPSVVASSTTASGISAAEGTIAGSATYPAALASGAKNANLGSTGVSVLEASLTFIAPRDSPAGTYISTITLTLTTR
jgi:hypothetical protein